MIDMKPSRRGVCRTHQLAAVQLACQHVLRGTLASAPARRAPGAITRLTIIRLTIAPGAIATIAHTSPPSDRRRRRRRRTGQVEPPPAPGQPRRHVQAGRRGRGWEFGATGSQDVGDAAVTTAQRHVQRCVACTVGLHDRQAVPTLNVPAPPMVSTRYCVTELQLQAIVKLETAGRTTWCGRSAGEASRRRRRRRRRRPRRPDLGHHLRGDLLRIDYRLAGRFAIGLSSGRGQQCQRHLSVALSRREHQRRPASLLAAPSCRVETNR
jgi:hypothetical protein